MDADLTALATSFVLLLIALGWNIYRDIVLKPNLKVRFQIGTLAKAGGPVLPNPQYLLITAVNHSPAKVTCNMIHVRTAPLWRRLVRKLKHGVIIGDWTNPVSGKLPATLEVGQTLNLLLPYEKGCFLLSEVTHVGIIDSFGRSHWAPRWDLNQARVLYEKAFGETSSDPGPVA